MQFANGGDFDHIDANRGQNRRHLQSKTLAPMFAKLIPTHSRRQAPRPRSGEACIFMAARRRLRISRPAPSLQQKLHFHVGQR